MTWGDVPAVIQIHILAALVALVVGSVQLARAKGTASHRLIGWAWIAVMLVVTGSSFFIQAIRPGHYSFIHLIAIWTLFSLGMAVWEIRVRHRPVAHAGWMIGTFVGGLLVAGSLAAFGGNRILGRLLG